MVVVVLTLPLELSSAVVQENEYLTISGLHIHLGWFLGGWNALFKMTGPCLSFGIKDKLLGSVTNALSLILWVLVWRSVADWLRACFLFPLAIEGCPSSVCSSSGLCYEWHWIISIISIEEWNFLHTISYFWYTKWISMAQELNKPPKCVVCISWFVPLSLLISLLLPPLKNHYSLF